MDCNFKVSPLILKHMGNNDTPHPNLTTSDAKVSKEIYKHPDAIDNTQQPPLLSLSVQRNYKRMHEKYNLSLGKTVYSILRQSTQLQNGYLA